jgi:hypothetical protein
MKPYIVTFREMWAGKWTGPTKVLCKGPEGYLYWGLDRLKATPLSGTDLDEVMLNLGRERNRGIVRILPWDIPWCNTRTMLGKRQTLRRLHSEIRQT